MRAVPSMTRAFTAEEKQRIVSALNHRFGTSVPLELVEIAVASELTTWEKLEAETRA